MEGGRRASGGMDKSMQMAASGTYNRPGGGRSRRSRSSSRAGSRRAKSVMGDVLEGVEDDSRINWFRETACSVLNVSTETFRHLLDKRESRQAISTFFDTATCRVINFILEEAPAASEVVGVAGKGKIKCTNDLPPQHAFEIGCVTYVKQKSHRLSQHDPSAQVIMLDLKGGLLRHLTSVARYALFPLLSMPQNRKGLTNAAVADFSYATEEFVCLVEIMNGRLQDEVVLPLPTSINLDDVKAMAKSRNSIRMLEFSVLAWTKQIRWSAMKEPDDQTIGHVDYWPSKELDFWGSRAVNLRAILLQLQSPMSCKVMEALQLSQSTYCVPLRRAIEDVTKAGWEAQSNTTYLETMRKYLTTLEDPSIPFATSSCSDALDDDNQNAPTHQPAHQMFWRREGRSWPELLLPVMHTLYLISKNSPFYNTAHRIGLFILLLESVTIQRARLHVYNGGGNEVFVNDSTATCERLEDAMKGCLALQDLYRKYETLSQHDYTNGSNVKESAWTRPATGLFARLDRFLERCQDVLYLAKSASTVAILRTVQIGGADGYRTTLRAHSLHEDFCAALQQLTDVDYNLLVVEQPTDFELDFIRFCNSFKALQERGVSIVQQAFEDCHSLRCVSGLILCLGQVVELDAFRPLLAKMLTQVLELYCKQLDATRSTFISQQRSESNTIADTLPTITRKLYWAKALMDSLRAMQSTLSLLQRLFESCKIDGYQEAFTGTSMLLNAISKLDVVTYRLWVQKVETLPEDLLNQPLVVILEPTQDDTDLSSNGTQTSSIKVNFNDNVLEIIKEAKYLKYQGYDLPGMASYLYDRSEKIRGYIGHLKLIANKYNNLYAMTQEPEWPLVGRILYHLHELLIEVSNVITWKSNRIDDTIIKMTTELNIATETMDKLKRNRAEIMRILEEEWGERPLFRFKKTQSYSLSAFDSMHSGHVEARYKVLKSGARTINALIEDNIVVSGANWTMPCFVDYADYLRTLCSDWLKAFVKDNLLRLLDALAYENTDSMTSGQNRSEAQNEMSVAMALIEMTLELLHGTVFEYVPPIKSADSHQKTVESSVLQWRDSILEATSYATHDPLSLDFKAEIAADIEIVRLQNLVGDCIDKTAQSCSEYRDSFADYEFLWLEAGEERFQHVVRTVIMPNGDKLPNMHAMGEIVHHLLDLQVRLTTYLDFKRIDWVRVDSRPLKSAIATLLSCRLERHIVLLKECLGKNLDSLNAYLVQTMGELTKASDLRTGNEYMLSLVLRAVRSIKEKKREFEATMRSSESIATFLQGHGWAIEPSREAQLTSTLKLWTEMQKFALQVKDKYSSLIAQEIERLRKRGTNLEETCANAKRKYALAPIWAPGDTSDLSYDIIREMHNEIRWLLCSQIEVYEMESLLESTPMHNCMPIINECFLMMYAAKTLWDVHELVGHSLRTWNFIKWADVCVDKMLVEAQEFMQMLMEVSQSQNQNTQHILQYYVSNSTLYTKIQEEIQYMLDSLPLALELQSPFLRERHFKKIMSISGQAFALDENVLFRNILSLQLPSFADDIYTLVDSAERELCIQEVLTSLEDRWAQQKLVSSRHSDSGRQILSTEMERVVSNILEIDIQLQRLLSNRFAEVFRECGNALQKSLAQAVDFIECMMSAQSLWLTLEGLVHYDKSGLLEMVPELKDAFKTGIFDSPDSGLTHDFLKILDQTVTYQSMKEMMPFIRDIHGKANALMNALSGMMKLLEDWLEQRRRVYTRFYFLSDKELIKILSDGMRSPRNLVAYLPRIFHGINSLTFATSVHSTGNEVVAIGNQRGETLNLDQPLQFKAHETHLESWFKNLESQVSQALKKGVMEGVMKMSTNRLAHWALLECLQTVLLSLKVHWTGLVERALDVQSFSDSMQALQNLLDSSHESVERVTQYLRDMKLEPLKRAKYSIILTYEVWCTDALEYVVRAHKYANHWDSSHTFEWQIQMRYYLRHAESPEDSSCRVRVGDSELDYGFEFMNVAEPFCFCVTTRAFMAVAMIMKHQLLVALGSSACSSPCSGKTETFKQMAMATGKQMHVFSSTSHVVHKVIRDALLGLSQCGAWGLWENFDKTCAALMCYTASLIKSIMNALRGGHQADVDGICITPSPAFGFFMTFRGRGKGTQELPHDVRMLVRPVSIVPPDFKILAQLLLIGQGFTNHDDLSKKLCAHLKLCRSTFGSHEISREAWWSISSLSTIIRAAGKEKLNGSELTDETLIVAHILRFNATILLPAQGSVLMLITEHVFGSSHVSVAQAHVISAHALHQSSVHAQQLLDSEGESTSSPKRSSERTTSNISSAGTGTETREVRQRKREIERGREAEKEIGTEIDRETETERETATGRETGGGGRALEQIQAGGEKGREVLTGDALVRANEEDFARTADLAVACKVDKREPARRGQGRSFEAAEKKLQEIVKAALEDGFLDEEEQKEIVWYRGFSPSQGFMKKIDQLREILSVRSSTYIIGAPSVGKTEIWRSLAVMGQEGRKVVVKIINPNALDNNIFCGSFNGSSGQWRPGAISNLLRNPIQNSSKPYQAIDFKWIVLDGEVQPEWLELLSSSLDSCRYLALDSAEVLHCGPELRILMEACSLKHAPPSAAARNALLYVDDTVVLIENIVDTWLRNMQRNSLKSQMKELFSQKLQILLDFMEKSAAIEFFVPVSARSCCQSMLRILDGLILAEGDNWLPSSRAEKCLWMFDFAAVWGFGGAMAVDKVLDCRRIFSDWWKQNLRMFGNRNIVTTTGTIFDYTFNPSTFKMCMWKDLVSPTKYFPQSSKDEMLVSSPMSVCIHRILEVTTEAKHRMLVVGEHGAGKTCIVQDFLKGLPISFASRRIALHVHCTAGELQKQISQLVQKKAGQVYVPYDDKTLVLFIDDLTTPPTNNNDIRSTAALLHQHIEHNIWYELEDLRCCEIKNVQYVGAMLPSLGADAVDVRLLNKFCIIAVPVSNQHAIASIFTSILATFTQSFEPEVRRTGETLGLLTAYSHARLADHFSNPRHPVHYHFSMHTVRSVLNSICRANAELYSSPVMYISLWFYEMQREYCDRLQTKSEIDVFKVILKESIHKHLHSGMSDDLRILETAHIADFASGTVSPSRVSGKQWCETFSERLIRHNENNAHMEMVIWDNVVKHLLRITRVLKRDRGCLLFFGEGSSGRESMVRLASFCCDAQLVTPISISSSGRGEDEVNLRKDLESSLMVAGLTGRAVTFLLKDSIISSSKQLILINEIFQGDFLYGAEEEQAEEQASPSPQHLLFDSQTKARIVKEMKEAERGVGQEEEQASTAEHVWTRFIQGALNKLHVIFCLETKAGLGCLSDFPIFAKKCSINYFAPLEDADRVQIVSQKVQSLCFHADQRENARIRYAVVHAMGSFFTLAQDVGCQFSGHCNRQCAMGLSQHLDLVNIFMKSLESSALYAKERLQLLENCRSRVDDLRALATQLEATQKTCGEDVLEQEKFVSEHIITIGRMTAEIEAHMNVTKKSESDVTARQQDLNRSSAALNEVRLKVEPPFKVASSELKLMDNLLLGEVKSYNTPPLAVERVMTVAIKLSTEPSKGGTWDCSWPRAKRTIGNADRFIMDLLAVDPRTIDANGIENVRPYLENSADVSGIADISEPLSLVWDWAVCLLEYVDAYHDKILPLEESISKNTQLLNEAKKNLVRNKREKDQLEFKLAKVTQQFEEASTKKSSLQTNIKEIIAKVDNVRILIGLLENDEPLWKREHDDLMQKRQNTLGDSLISAALIAFCGPLSQSYRSALLSSCKNRLNQLHIPLSLSCQPVDLFLHPEDEYRAYDEGLPILKYGSRNTHALENCVISSNSLRCSLFMDPDSMALSWCRALSCGKEEDRQLRLLDRDESFVERLKVCVNAGVTVLCTITPQQSDPILHGLLQMRVIKKGKQRYIEIGPDQVELGAGFKLLLRCSCVTQPLPIAVTSKSAIINFSMSDEDLEDCLLAMVVAAHEQQVERERQNLLDDLVKNSLQVARHNNEVIDKMRNMTGNLMSFEEVERMKIFKINVDEGREKLKSTEARMGEIQRVAATYSHFARLLFVACHFTRNLWQMNMVYYFSLHEMLMVLDAGVLRCVAEKHDMAAEVGLANDTNVQQKILENKLTCFLAEFEPEQVESAAKIAAMFADDHSSLQEMLKDMYAVRLEYLSRKAWEAGFDIFDMDGDGFITRAEFESLERGSIDAFTALDVDGDGRITREEYNAGFDILTRAEQEISLQSSRRESDDATNQHGQASPFMVKVHKIDGFSDTAGFLDRTDPYVSLQFGSEKQKTSYKSDAGGTVIFNETLTFLNIDYQGTDSILKIQVFDKDIQKTDDLMGQYDGDLTYAQVNSQEPVAFVCMHKGKPSGNVFLSFPPDAWDKISKIKQLRMKKIIPAREEIHELALKKKMEVLALKCIAELNMHVSQAMELGHRDVFLVTSFFECQIALGRVNREVCEQLLTRQGPAALSTEEAVKIFRGIDVSGDGEISMREFIKALRSNVSLANQLRLPNKLGEAELIDIFYQIYMSIDSDGTNTISMEEFLAYHTGSRGADERAQPAPLLLESEKMAVLATHVHPFDKIYSQWSQVENDWRVWMASENAEEMPMPCPMQLDDWRRILVVAALRPDRLGITVRTALHQLLPSGHDFKNPSGCIDHVLKLHASARKSFLPSRISHHWPVPVLLVTSNEIDSWNEVLRTATDHKLLSPTQSTLILSAAAPNLETLLLHASQTDAWVLVKDISLQQQATSLIDQLLERLAFVQADTVAGDDLRSVEGQTPQKLPKTHSLFRLFISALSVDASSLPSVCLWNKCIKFYCTQAPIGIKSAYLKLEAGQSILRGRSEQLESQSGQLSKVLRRAILIHLIINRLSLGWRLPYAFEPQDLFFGKERLIEILLTDQTSAAIFQRRQTILNFQNISYMLSELVHGGRIDDVWDIRVVQELSRRIFPLDDELIDAPSCSATSTSVTPPAEFSLEEGLQSFFAAYAPDQVASAGEVAAMFSDDFDSLQSLLSKKYGACLSLSHGTLTGGSSMQQDIDMLIDEMEGTLLAGMSRSDDSQGNLFVAHLQAFSSAVAATCPDGNAPTGAAGASNVRGVINAGADQGDQELLDEIREKMEEISRLLPVRLIPLRPLLLSIEQKNVQRFATAEEEGGKRGDNQRIYDERPLMHAVINECKTLNNLLETLHSSLLHIDMSLLRNSLVGGTKQRALACARCLVAGEIPKEWTKCSYPTTKPLAAWLRDLVDVRLPQAFSWTTKEVRWNGLADGASSDGCINLGSLMCPQVFMAAFLLSSRTENQRVAESGSDDTRHVTRLDAPSAERTVEERLKGLNSVPPVGVKGNAIGTPSTATNVNQKPISSTQQPKAISNQEQNTQRPQTFGLIGAGELTPIGAAHLMLRASITGMTRMPQRVAQVQDEHVWYVSGLHLQGASWVADDTNLRKPAKDSSTSESQGLYSAAGRFVTRPAQALLPIVALSPCSAEIQGFRSLVPVYQSRHKDSTLVAVLLFENAGNDKNWAAAANITLES